jgi:hypothetical protein
METIKIFKNTLFIDIETVSGSENFSSISDKMKEFWVKKDLASKKKQKSEVLF